MAAKTKCLVTGGCGFVGRRLVKELISTGRYDVTVFDLNPPPESDPLPEDVVFIHGDLTQAEQVTNSFKDVKIVFHVATAAPTSENALSEDLMRRVNIDGTRNVIEACMHQHVEKLIYTSSASVAFGGTDVLDKNEEELGYASPPIDHYTGTKTVGEQMVLAANGSGGLLATCALRPSAVFGEGDALLLPTLVKRAKQGKMKYMIGSGENIYDFTYVGNVIQAHLLAAEKLSLTSPIAGQAYFITNQEPRKFWEFTGDLLEGLGYERPHIKYNAIVPMDTTCHCGVFLILPLTKPFVKLSSDLSMSRLKLMTSHRAFNSKKAIEQLGYRPKVSMDEAAQRTIRSFEHLRNRTT